MSILGWSQPLQGPEQPLVAVRTNKGSRGSANPAHELPDAPSTQVYEFGLSRNLPQRHAVQSKVEQSHGSHTDLVV